MPLPLLALIGLGVSTAVSTGTAIANAAKKTPDIPGPTGEQRLGQGLLQAKANQLASGQGLSETEYNRPIESAQKQVSEAAATGMEATRTASPFMSNIAAERIAKTFASKGADIISETRKELTSMDIRQSREDLKTSAQIQAKANEQANEIARVEREKKMQEEAWRRQKLQGIITVAGQAAGSFLKLAEIGEGMGGEPQAGSTDTSANLAEPNAAPTSGPVAQMGQQGLSLFPDNTLGLQDIDPFKYNPALQLFGGGGTMPNSLYDTSWSKEISGNSETDSEWIARITGGR